MINESIKFAKNFDIISIMYMIIAVIILCVCFYKKEKVLLGTISKTVAKNKKISLIFSIVMSLGIPLYYGSILLYLSPKYEMPIMFDILLILAFILEMVFIWCPARDKTAKIHTRTALAVAIIMVFEALFVALFGYNISNFLKGIAIIYFISCMLLAVLLIINRKVQQKSFILQCMFIVLFIIVFMLLQHM